MSKCHGNVKGAADCLLDSAHLLTVTDQGEGHTGQDQAFCGACPRLEAHAEDHAVGLQNLLCAVCIDVCHLPRLDA